MSVLKHLYLDDIITSFPELGPTIQDGGYSWIILIGVFLIQVYQYCHLLFVVFIKFYI